MRHVALRSAVTPLAVVLAFLAGCNGSIGAAENSSGHPSESEGSGGTSSSNSPNAVEALPPVTTTRFARLTHSQWENATRDLLHLPAAPGLAATFIGDPSPGVFNNDGNTLQVTPELWSDYQAAAEALADRVAMDPVALARLLPTNVASDPAGRAMTFIQSFGLRAYRRPLTPAEVQHYQALFASAPAIYQGPDPFVDGARLALRAFLQSPHFLYRTELGSGAAKQPIPLDRYEVAAKVWLTLAKTIPDDATLAAAADGQPVSRVWVHDLAEELLTPVTAKALVDDFHSQLLMTKGYESIDKDPTVFPDFMSGIGGDMKTETLTFAHEVAVTSGGGLRELLLSPYTFVNQRLAPIYGVSGAFDDQFKKVDLDPATRAGLLTQLGFLSANAARTTVSTGTIHRGVFIMRRLLCREISPPPGLDFSKLPPGTGPTNRARIDNLTSAAGCAPCHHVAINPLGFAFETFDALGHARKTDEAGLPIDAHGSATLGGKEVAFDGAVQLSQKLADDVDVHSCYASGWLEYLHGRLAGSGDASLLSGLADRSQAGTLPVPALVLELVTGDSFLTRLP